MTRGLYSSFAYKWQRRHNTEAALTYLGHIDFCCDAEADWPILNLYYKKIAGKLTWKEKNGKSKGESKLKTNTSIACMWGWIP